MSKLIYPDGFNKHQKDKHRRSLRRYKSKLIGEARKRNIKNSIYSSDRGYYLREERRQCEYEYKDFPEQTERMRVFARWKRYIKVVPDDSSGELDIKSIIYYKPIYEWKTYVSPAHRERKFIKIERIPIKPYLRRFHKKKKWYKQQASRAVRRTSLGNGSEYKRIYDIDGEFL